MIQLKSLSEVYEESDITEDSLPMERARVLRDSLNNQGAHNVYSSLVGLIIAAAKDSTCSAQDFLKEVEREYIQAYNRPEEVVPFKKTTERERYQRRLERGDFGKMSKGFAG